MEILVDTSIYLSVCLNEPTKTKVVALTVGAVLVSPSSVYWEFGNALSGMVKRGRLSIVQAKACIAAFERIPIRFIDVELGASLQLGQPHRMWAYDAYVLQGAFNLGLPLLTLDGPQSKIAQRMGIELWENVS